MKKKIVVKMAKNLRSSIHESKDKLPINVISTLKYKNYRNN